MGISIGWVIESSYEYEIIKAVFLSLASGNLIFIVIVKSFIEEFFISRIKTMKAIGFCLGVLMVIIFHLNELIS